MFVFSPQSAASGTQDELEPELKVLSVIPHEQPPEWKPESSHMYKYLVTAHSTIIFLTHNYCIVYCLDMSPSLSAVVSAVKCKFMLQRLMLL